MPDTWLTQWARSQAALLARPTSFSDLFSKTERIVETLCELAKQWWRPTVSQSSKCFHAHCVITRRVKYRWSNVFKFTRIKDRRSNRKLKAVGFLVFPTKPCLARLELVQQSSFSEYIFQLWLSSFLSRLRPTFTSRPVEWTPGYLFAGFRIFTTRQFRIPTLIIYTW